MENQEPRYYFLPLPDREDVEQEMALQRLLGKEPKRPPRSVVYGREMSYGLITPDGVPPLDTGSSVNMEALETLMEWLQTQSDQIQVAVLAFLADPENTRRWKTVARLINIVEIPQPSPEEKRRSQSLVGLILRVLPANIDDLYQMARQQHPSRRPEAAVRQILRRLTREQKVVKRGDLYYVAGR